MGHDHRWNAYRRADNCRYKSARFFEWEHEFGDKGSAGYPNERAWGRRFARRTVISRRGWLYGLP